MSEAQTRHVLALADRCSIREITAQTGLTAGQVARVIKAAQRARKVRPAFAMLQAQGGQ